MAKKDPDAQDAGNYITIGGLILQLLVFGFFMIISVAFYLRISRQPTRRSQNALNPWRKHLFVLYLSSLLIMIRSVFRLVEYVQGEDGYLLGSEVWLYVFDAALVLVVVILFNLVHPSQMRGMVGGEEKFDLAHMTTVPQSGNVYEQERESRENITAVAV
ncbi:RTA1-domain-containing [Fusarium albosuccineum]|uniref:RTA1-domain-containing n=1 Tax=Fusarium albosuccineum TaxID=1237068 RepID=A0A8H4KJH7_9HYPO|nr:RTA1-domain-containing [Fusarium albosuccineum]